jgi:hypothetical protein
MASGTPASPSPTPPTRCPRSNVPGNWTRLCCTRLLCTRSPTPCLAKASDTQAASTPQAVPAQRCPDAHPSGGSRGVPRVVTASTASTSSSTATCTASTSSSTATCTASTSSSTATCTASGGQRPQPGPCGHCKFCIRLPGLAGPQGRAPGVGFRCSRVLLDHHCDCSHCGDKAGDVPSLGMALRVLVCHGTGRVRGEQVSACGTNFETRLLGLSTCACIESYSKCSTLDPA